MRYYNCGKINIKYTTKAAFVCKCRERATGDLVTTHVEETRSQIDRDTEEIITIRRRVKLHKGIKVHCPLCNEPIVFKGWLVEIVDTSKRRVIGGMFTSGDRTVKRTYYTTIKSRTKAINSALNKYSK